MVAGGELYLGDNQKSCEFGHVTLIPDGRPCYCGQRGCANAYLSASLLSNMTEGKLDRFFALADEGQEPYAAALREYLLYLAIAVNNLRMQYDCDIILGGYVGAYMKPHIDDFREMVRQRNRFRDDGLFIHCCRHRYETAAMGAALFFVEQFIQNLE